MEAGPKSSIAMHPKMAATALATLGPLSLRKLATFRRGFPQTLSLYSHENNHVFIKPPPFLIEASF
jgi:hypothetical protein